MKRLFYFLSGFIFLFYISVFAQSDHTIGNGNFTDPGIWSSGSVPTQLATISSGTTVTLTSPYTLYDGILVEPNASFWMTNGVPLTLSSFVNEGNFYPGNGSVNFETNSVPFFSGMPTSFYDVYVYGDVPFYSVVTVTNSLWLEGGSAQLDEGGSLYMGPGATISSTMGFDKYHCVYPRASDETYGYLGRYAQYTSDKFIFPVGTIVNGVKQYSPMIIDYTSSNITEDAHFVVSPVAQKHPENTSSDNYINRYWEVYSQGFSDFAAVVTCTYTPQDVVGDESALWGGKKDWGMDWQRLGPVDVDKHSFSGSVDGFSDFTAGEYDVMPVELTSFTVLYDGEANLLSWETATETNNYGFEIERALSRQGGTTPGHGDWEMIGFVEGNNTSSSPNKYHFADKDIDNGTYYYRLRQIDLDGTASYSQTVNVEVGSVPKGFVLNQNYPNPFNPSTIISFGSSKKTEAKLIIFDQLGREVETIFDGTIEENEIKKISFDAAGYSGGVYFYKLVTPEWSATKKMMLLK